MERGWDGAGGVATGGTGGTEIRLGSKLKETERLDLGRVAGMDKGWTVKRQIRWDFRIHLDEVGLSLVDEVDIKEGVSKVNIEEIDRSFFTLPPPENPQHYLYHHHHHHYHTREYYHH